MKLTLNTSEAVGLIQNRIYPSMDIAITPDFACPPEKKIDLMSFLNLVRRFNFRGNEKIAAIKAIREEGFRQGVSIGLADAKFFVENL